MTLDTAQRVSGVGWLRRRGFWYIVLALVVAGGLYLNGYHLTPTGAARVGGQIMLTQDFPGGRALLVQDAGGCNVVLIRRAGPFWRSFGWAACRFERPTHPFSWAGRGSCTTGGKYCVEAVGGTFSDPRIARIRYGHQEHDVAGRGGFLFANKVERLGPVPPMEALAADGAVLFHLNEGTNLEWQPSQG